MASSVYLILAVISVTVLTELARCQRAEGEPASNQAVARRQEGVFFGLGGLDENSMPFDLDAFFEHAAPTRTARKSVTTTGKFQANRVASAKTTLTPQASIPSTTSRSFAAPETSDGHQFDFQGNVQTRRSFAAPSRFAPSQPLTASGRAGSRRNPSESHSQLPTRRPSFQQPEPQEPQNVHSSSRGRGQSSPTFDESQGFRRETHNSATLQHRFSPQTSNRHQQPDTEATKDFVPDEQPPLPVRRPLVPFRERRPEIVPTETHSAQDEIASFPQRVLSQHAPFRPSLASRTSQRLPATQDSVSSATLPDDHTTSFDNRQGFLQEQLPVRRPSSDTDNSQFQQAPQPARHQKQQSQPDTFQEYDDDSGRPLSAEEFPEDQFQDEPRDTSDSPATQPFFSSEEEDDRRTSLRRPQVPRRQFDSDQGIPVDDDVRHSQEDIFDSPSQDSPPQDVDEETNDFESQFFVPESQESERRRPQPTTAPPAPVFTSDVREVKRPALPERFPQRTPTPPENFDAHFRQPIAHRPTAAAFPQPSLSHRGISGVVGTSQQRKPDPRPISHSNRQPIQSSPPFRPRQNPPVPSEVPGSNFDFRGTVDTTPAAPPKSRFREVHPPPSATDQRQFRPVPDHLIRSSAQRPHSSTDDDFSVTQSFPRQDRERVLTHVPAQHSNAGRTTASTPQVYPGNADFTGQLSASFARATEPTRFETETERPVDVFTTRQQPVPTMRGRSLSRAPQQQVQQLLQQQAVNERRQQQSRFKPTSSGVQPSRESEFLFDSPPSTVDDSTQFQSPQSSDEQFSQHLSAGNDFSSFRRPSSSVSESDRNLQASRKQLPITVSRGSKRRPFTPGTPGLTTPTQFATENAIDDQSLQAPIPSRSRSGDPSIQNSKVSAIVTPGQVATVCNSAVCHLPNCFCGGNQIQPGNLKPEDIPQIVVLTFDDAVNDLNWKLYNRLFFEERRNPNGCPILATFYVSHEWTDYSKVQNLYAAGHEIASHSISHGDGRDYSKKKWYSEIYGQKEILNVYANVKLDDVKGMRSPFLAMGGDKQFSMLYDTNFTYDTSMTVTDVHPPFWPYTLDYAMPHRCAIPPCPKLSYPGFWEIPMVALTDLNGGKCSMADSCSFSTTEDGIYEMLMKNFNRHYSSNRAPFGLYYHASWFLIPHRQEGFVKFLDEVLKKDDVYFVTALQMLDWVKNPTPLSKIKHFEPWQCQKKDTTAPCSRPRSCELRFKGDLRYMSTCNSCPNVYPWVGDTGITNHAHTISP